MAGCIQHKVEKISDYLRRHQQLQHSRRRRRRKPNSSLVSCSIYIYRRSTNLCSLLSSLGLTECQFLIIGDVEELQLTAFPSVAVAASSAAAFASAAWEMSVICPVVCERHG